MKPLNLESVPLRLLVLDHHGRGRDLLVAPVLVVVLVLLLRHEVEDHLLDHVLDLVERARARRLLKRRDLLRQLLQRCRLLRAASFAQQVDDRRLRVRDLFGNLDQADTLAFRSANTGNFREDLNGLAHRLNLISACLHALLVFLLALAAQLLRLVEHRLVRVPRARCFRERGLGRGQVLRRTRMDDHNTKR